MPKRAKQKAPSPQAALPGLGHAQAFVCHCFGISEKNLDATLQRIRSRTPDADRHFPRKWSRVLPVRADAKKSRRREAILTVQREALYDRIRRACGQPLLALTGSVTEKIVFSLLRMYEKLLPHPAIIGKQGGESTKARIFAGTIDFLDCEPHMDHARLTPLICRHSATVASRSKPTFLVAARCDLWCILSWLRIQDSVFFKRPKQLSAAPPWADGVEYIPVRVPSG